MRQALFRAPAKSMTKVFNAPTRGWVTSENQGRVSPETASTLENWFPTLRGARARAGSSKVATITGAVTSTFTYEADGVSKHFAASSTAIYDVTSVADPDVVPTADITGQSSGDYSTAIQASAGGVFLTAVNGTDTRQIFDGTSWATTPAITGVSSSDLSHVWLYRSRLFFIEKDTLTAWALGVDSIGGAATEISLSGLFSKGGSLLFGATWSIDAGDGIDDVCLFVTDKGQVAVYKGNDPSDPNNWSLSGIYEIGPPLGKNATMRVGGDILIATEDGLIAVSSAIQKDRIALSLTALSQPIESEWRRQIQLREGVWQITKWPDKNMMVISFGSAENYIFVANLQTGAWAKYTGWDAQCTTLFDNNLYFGTSDGRILKGEVGGNDDGNAYTATYIGGYEALGSPANYKVAKMTQGVFVASAAFIPRLGVSTDFKDQLGQAPIIASDSAGGLWDSALWDSANWDGLDSRQVSTKWVSAFGNGQYIAPRTRIGFNGQTEPNIELIAQNLIYETGHQAV